MKKLFAVVLCAAVAGMAFAAPAKKAAKTPAKAKAEFVIVESDVYAAGKEDPQLTAGIAQFLDMTPSVTHVSYKDAAADPKLANLDYSFLPLYLIKKNKDVRTKLEKHLEYGYARENDDFIILPRQTRSGVYSGKTAKPDVMEIFVMSQCPYGVMAENLVIEAQKAGTFPKDKEVRVRYIVDYSDEKGFNSLHGSGEWEENVRQLLIAKYYPSKFWKYLEIRNKDYRSSRWDKAMEQAGINPKKIMKKFDTEGLELLKEEAKYGKEYGVNASPTFLWEGQVQLDFGSASKIDGFGFLNPNASKADAAAPAGSC
ncbi:MAG: hypothetical protein ACI4Q7_01380 [Candidatus Avelusimicrobium sp.]